MNDLFGPKGFKGNDIEKIFREARIKESLGIMTNFKEKYEYLEVLKGAIIRGRNFEYEGPQNDGVDHGFEVDIALKSIEFEMEYLEKLIKFESGTETNMGSEQAKGKIGKRFKLPQQMLLMNRLGIIKYFDKYNLTTDKKALLISIMIGNDHQNIRKFLPTLDLPNHKDTCNTPKNNKLIDELLSALGIS